MPADLDARADPEALAILGMIPKLDLSGDISTARAENEALMRPLLAALPDVEGVDTRDLHVPGFAPDDPDVLVRVYTPADREHTGGALSYIDGMGAKAFVKLAKDLQKQYGKQFKAPKLLADMAEKGETFYQRFNPYKDETKKAA